MTHEEANLELKFFPTGFMLGLKSYAPGPGASQQVYFSLGSLVFGLIENFLPSVPTTLGIL